jgi:hypothetical protein
VLTASGYTVAMIVYLASALLALVLGNVWLLPRAGLGLRALVTLPLAGLLLTPAYIEAGADTLAPALVVTAFQMLSSGPEAAAHALQPLAVFSGAGLALGLVIFLLALLRRGRDANSDSEPDPAA